MSDAKFFLDFLIITVHNSTESFTLSDYFIPNALPKPWYNGGMKKTKEKKIRQLEQMLRMWLETDIVKAGTNFYYIERKNEAFARGWRFAVHSILGRIEEL